MIARSSTFKRRLMMCRAISRRMTATVAAATKTVAMILRVGPSLSLLRNNWYCGSANDGLLDPKSLFFIVHGDRRSVRED